MRTSTPIHTTRRGRFRKVAGAVVATAVATATLIPLTAGIADAAVNPTTVSVACGSTVAVGSFINCTITVTDDNGFGDPTGTASLTLTGTASAVPASSSCNLVGNTSRGKDESSCAIEFLAYGQKSDGTAGSVTVNASYVSNSTANWANDASTSTGSDTVSTTLPSNMVMTNLSKISASNTATSFGASTQTFYFSNCNYTSAHIYQIVALGSSSTIDPATTTSVTWGLRDLGAVSSSTKSLTWTFTIPADSATGTFRSKFMCVAGTTSSRSGDSNIKYTSSTYTGSVTGTSGGANTALLRTDAASAPAPTGNDSPTFSLTSDPDALNSSDDMGIVKAGADELKRRTDALLPASAIVSRVGYTVVDGGLDRATTEKWTAKVAKGASAADLAGELLNSPGRSAFTAATNDEFVSALYLRGLGRSASAGELAGAVSTLTSGGSTRAQMIAAIAGSAEAATHWNSRSFIVAAFQSATARMPSGDELDRFTNSLTSGNFKVNVVEDIALGSASAAEWNTSLPLGHNPASATFKAPATSPAPAPVVVRPPVAAPAPVAKAPAAHKATAKRRAVVRKSRKAVVRKAHARKVVAKRTATVRKVRR